MRDETVLVVASAGGRRARRRPRRRRDRVERRRDRSAAGAATRRARRRRSVAPVRAVLVGRASGSTPSRPGSARSLPRRRWPSRLAPSRWPAASASQRVACGRGSLARLEAIGAGPRAGRDRPPIGPLEPPFGAANGAANSAGTCADRLDAARIRPLSSVAAARQTSVDPRGSEPLPNVDTRVAIPTGDRQYHIGLGPRRAGRLHPPPRRPGSRRARRRPLRLRRAPPPPPRVRHARPALYKGLRVSCVSTGIGTDNVEIVISEILAIDRAPHVHPDRLVRRAPGRHRSSATS